MNVDVEGGEMAYVNVKNVYLYCTLFLASCHTTANGVEWSEGRAEACADGP